MVEAMPLTRQGFCLPQNTEKGMGSLFADDPIRRYEIVSRGDAAAFGRANRIIVIPELWEGLATPTSFPPVSIGLHFNYATSLDCSVWSNAGNRDLRILAWKA